MAYDCASNGESSPLSSPPVSDSDSEISVLSKSPSPPPGLFRYPSPSSTTSSQRSSAKTSPAPEIMAPTPSSGNDDGRPPRKKRKLADPKERTTERLDLRLGEVAAEEKPQLERLLRVLHKKRKIVVIAGAGISVSAGIPDFRSSTGLFKSLRKSHKLRSSGKDLFDASVYQDDSSTSTFHDMVRSLSQSTKNAKPTAFHHLLATLAHEGRLLRLYSQNVDGIDTSLPPLKTEVPLPKKGPWPKTIQLHGGLDHMVCSKCHALSDFDAEQFNGPIPPACGDCVEKDNVRQVADKRSHGIGRLRPRMVLYNEHNPDDEAIGSCARLDLRTRPDAIIVAGTTLKVPGVRRIVREMCAVVRDRRDGTSIWINNDPEPLGKDLANSWDLVVRGPCDEVARLAAMPRWDDPIDFKEVTDEQLSKTKEKQRAEVVVVSPKKSTAVEQVQGQMLTPAQSPRMRAQLVIKPEPTTPTKSNGRKRKSEGAKLDAMIKVEARKPRQTQAQPKKKPGRKSKANNGNNGRITDQFTVAKNASKSSSTKFIPSKYSAPDTAGSVGDDTDIIRLAPAPTTLAKIPRGGAQCTGWKNVRPHMAILSSSNVRNNAPTIPSPKCPSPEPFSDPPEPETPTHNTSFAKPYSEQPNHSRPSSASSRVSETVTPSSVPKGMGPLLT
ncbi:DHS-like NAD/FAD-binding domain-containing protein [Lojkania enalia]|uniref:DHS-like NAD/FAD-binding domain-containing protein n=1 Tax=Lojkania enalia TaxID=147567 RepID=A0A9P4N8W5_9PLEO|nr:DHS-like NAD/FAD-binding domain-containing protein [Didymosphaeria enalia]